MIHKAPIGTIQKNLFHQHIIVCASCTLSCNLWQLSILRDSTIRTYKPRAYFCLKNHPLISKKYIYNATDFNSNIRNPLEDTDGRLTAACNTTLTLFILDLDALWMSLRQELQHGIAVAIFTWYTIYIELLHFLNCIFHNTI
jgi:hypothetical protein